MKRTIPFFTRAANQISRWFYKSRVEKPYVPNPTSIEIGNWSQINDSREAKRLHLEVRGEDDGHNEVPPTHATQPETVGAHAEIISLIGNRVSKEHAACEDRLAQRNSTIDRCKSQIDEILNSLEAAKNQFKENLSQIKEANIRTLKELDEALESEEKEISNFKRANRISRPPRAPEERWWKLALLSVAFLGEGGMNTLFFALGSEFGLIGGVTLALGFAVLDGIIVCFLGMVIAWIASRKLRYKLIALISSTAFAGWAILYNFFVAHYREAAQKGLEDASGKAFETFKINPFSLDQPDSIMLVIIGFIISIIGMWTGYTWRDPIPGYQALGNRYRMQKQYFLSQHNRFLKSIRNEKSIILKDIDDKVKRATDLLTVFASAIRKKETLIKNFPKYYEDIKESQNTLIRIYETSNERSRSTPAPPFFNTHNHLKAPTDLSGQTGRDWNEFTSCQDRVSSKAGQNRTLKQDIQYLAEQEEEKYRQDRKNNFKSREAREL